MKAIAYSVIFLKRCALLAIIASLAGCGKSTDERQITPTPIERNVRLSDFFDVRPSTVPISYVYAPGFQGTELLMGRYCPSFTAATGEKVTWKSGGHVIGEPHSAVLFPEIDLRKPDYFTFNPITAYINGIRNDLASLAQRFMQDTFDFKVEENPNNPLSVVNYSFNFSKANLGQALDIKALKETYDQHVKVYPNHDVILYGDSRGAATIFSFIALEKPTHVKAAVLDGLFDDLPHGIKHFLYSDKKESEEKRLYDMAKLSLRSYQESSISPRKSAEIISDDVPLLIVISLKDGLVSAQSAFYLYNRLRALGHKKVHLLVLKHALHPGYMINEEDKKIYESTVHAFYKRYGLPHNGALAQLGQSTLALTQPTPEALEKTYQLPQCKRCNWTTK